MNKRAVAEIVNWDEKILIVKKNEDAEGILSGKWRIPGETLEENEDDIAGLIRGIKEEAGIEILRVERYLSSHITQKGTNVIWYECVPMSTNIKSGTDVSEGK